MEFEVRASIALGMLIAVYAALLFGPLLIRASQELRSHAAGSRPGDFKSVHVKGI